MARAPAARISGEANVPAYEAFGFTATLKIKISGNGPTHWVMWRNPGGVARSARCRLAKQAAVAGPDRWINIAGPICGTTPQQVKTSTSRADPQPHRRNRGKQ
jgi:hypothetical protein